MNANMIIACICPLCGRQTNIACTYEQYREYTLNPAALVQDVFADKDATTRETIISGMCKNCQDNFFIEEYEDDCDGECDTCFYPNCPSSQAYGDLDCNGVCELCEINDDCPNSTIG